MTFKEFDASVRVLLQVYRSRTGVREVEQHSSGFRLSRWEINNLIVYGRATVDDDIVDKVSITHNGLAIERDMSQDEMIIILRWILSV